MRTLSENLALRHALRLAFEGGDELPADQRAWLDSIASLLDRRIPRAKTAYDLARERIALRFATMRSAG